MTFRGIQNQEQIFNKWSALINCKDDITSDVVKMSTAIVLENAQEKIDEQYRTKHGRGLLLEDAGISNAPVFGPDTAATSYAATARDGSGVGDAKKGKSSRDDDDDLVLPPHPKTNAPMPPSFDLPERPSKEAPKPNIPPS